MREPRGQGAAGDDGVVGNADQPAQQPANKRRPLEPLITKDWGAIAGAVITAAGSLLIYSLAQVNHIDERLDRLEQEARVLVDGEGKVRPSAEALGAKYHLEALQDRIERLERHSQ